MLANHYLLICYSVLWNRLWSATLPSWASESNRGDYSTGIVLSMYPICSLEYPVVSSGFGNAGVRGCSGSPNVAQSPSSSIGVINAGWMFKTLNTDVIWITQKRYLDRSVTNTGFIPSLGISGNMFGSGVFILLLRWLVSDMLYPGGSAPQTLRPFPPLHSVRRH